MDPGTITFGVLSTVLGISGYGAVKATANQDEELQRQVNMRIKDAVAATESKLKMAEEARTRSEAEVARITAELEVLRSAKSTSPEPTVPEVQPEPVPEVQPEPPLQPIPEPTPAPAIEPPLQSTPALEGQPELEPQLWPEQPEDKARWDAECKNVLDGLEIKTKKDFRRWALRNHPDKGGDSALFMRVNDCATRLFSTGGLRKKKLRTRRHVKQNVRRSRSSKNRTDGAY